MMTTVADDVRWAEALYDRLRDELGDPDAALEATFEEIWAEESRELDELRAQSRARRAELDEEEAEIDARIAARRWGELQSRPAPRPPGRVDDPDLAGLAGIVDDAARLGLELGDDDRAAVRLASDVLAALVAVARFGPLEEPEPEPRTLELVEKPDDGDGDVEG